MATLLALPGTLVPRAHTALSVFAFVTALAIGYAAGLWEALCENSVAKWPVEWWPSVSATIGDHAAPRAPFHILIALTAVPRFVLLALQWLVHRYPPSSRSKDDSAPASSATTTATAAYSTRSRRKEAAAAPADAGHETHAHAAGTSNALVDAEVMCGLARTFCCGGWMYITSRDQHDLHDLFMIVYLVLNLPWMALSTMHSTNARARRWRELTAGGFLAMIPPLIYLFIQHNVKHIPGSYTYYAFFEWSLVVWDVAFDAACIFELDHLQIQVVDTTRGDQDGVSKSGTNGKGVFLAPVKTGPPRSEADWTAEPASAASSSPVRAVAAWLSDVWFATVFWTVFTGVSVQLFYWSVWSLSLTGSELSIFVNVTPYIFGKQSYRAYALSREGQFTHRAVLCVVGLGAYIIPHVAARFLCVMVAMWCGWCAFIADSMRVRGSPEMISQTKIFLTGLMVALLCKYNAYSNNPFWAIVNEASGGWNKTGLLLSAVALAELYYRPSNLFPSAPEATTLKDKPTEVVVTRAQRTAIIFGLGSLMHLLQTFLSDSGTVIAWTWTGYPVTGPTLHPWAGTVITFALAGLLATENLWSNPLTYLVPFPAAFLLVFYQDWLGFAGGLVLTFYFVAITPILFRAASALPPKVWGHAMAWNAFLDVTSVLTVAYAFVPFGWMFRERTDMMMLILLFPLPFALKAASELKLPGKESLQPRGAKRVASINKLTVVAYCLLMAVNFLSTIRFSIKLNVTPTPFYPDYHMFSAGIFTVHFGIDEPGRDSQRRIADLVREMEVDVLGMLETDLHRFVYGNRDLTRYIAEEQGYYVDLGPGPNSHTWGACLLSKFPILNSTHHLLPSPAGELAPAIHATLDVHGQRVDVLVSHNGQEEDPLDRELQTRELARLLNLTGDVPTVFLGYLITKLHEPAPSPYGILFAPETGLIDIETLDQWRWCEYLGFRNLWRVAYSRLEHSDVTDTELQVGKFILPMPGQTVRYESDADLYWHIAEENIPEAWRMPRMFRDDGVRGHAYRVWDGPLYYLPPLDSGVRGHGENGRTEWPPITARGDMQLAEEARREKEEEERRAKENKESENVDL